MQKALTEKFSTFKAQALIEKINELSDFTWSQKKKDKRF